MRRFLVFLGAGLACLAFARGQPAGRRDAATAAPRTDNALTHFLDKHAAQLERVRGGQFDLVFVGDSITEGWNGAPEVWQKYYGNYRAVNLGIGSSTTQNLLWRLENGMLDDVRARVVVLLIGTNNSAANSAGEVAAAIGKTVQRIRARVPAAKVLVLGVFPRGPRKNRDGSIRDDGVRRMEMIRALNPLLAKLDDGRLVRFADLSPAFIGPDGRIPEDVMPDQLHLGPKGYEAWAASMQPLLTEMLRN